MWEKRMICLVVACLLVAGTLSLPAYAVEAEDNGSGSLAENLFSLRATGSFNLTVPANTKAFAGNGFSMSAGETVTINASYAPSDASVDFGIVDDAGNFYYFNTTEGSINKTIQVTKSGNYTVQIRNNSSGEVKVSGFVNY